MRYDNIQDALTNLTTGKELAAEAFLFNGRATVIRIVNDEPFVCIIDDGGESILSISFASAVELDERLSPDNGDDDYSSARHRLIMHFLGNVVVTDVGKASIAATTCPHCGQPWGKGYSKVLVSNQEGDATGILCGKCFHQFTKSNS